MRNIFTEAILREQKRIQRFIDLSGADHVDRGSLHLQKQGHRTYGYERQQRLGQPERKIYLGTLDSAPVRELFSVKFKEQRLARLRHDQRLLQRLAQQYQPYDFDSVVSGMSGACKTAAKENTFDQRYEEVLAWANADYPRNPYPFPPAEIYAKDGTRVRSKGECIWYNLLLERSVLFRYDGEIEIVDQQGNIKRLCPDFLIRCLDGTMIIIEHLGRMGELRYALDFGERCYWYFQDGFILGKTFFATSDDSNFGTDSQMIARLADRIEEMFFGL